MKTYLACALMVLLGLPALAQAQDADAYTEAQKWKLVTIQLVETLEMTIDDVKTQALKNAIIYATLYRDKVDLGSAVGALRKVYEEDNHRSHRKLALAALQAIGNNRTTTFLVRHVTDEESEEGRVVMASVLNDFYLARTGASPAASASSPPSR